MNLDEANDVSVARVAEHRAPSPMLGWLDLSATLDDETSGHLYRLAFHERHIGNPLIRALHGGVISAFLESCATLEVTTRSDLSVRTISTHINFLRGAIDQDMQATVELARVGRRIAFLEATGWQTSRDQPVARAAIALRVFEPD